MSNNHLIVDISPREDKYKQIFYLGKLRFPGVIDCNDGVTFLIFVSESGDEQIQIAPIDKNPNDYSSYIRKSDRICIALESRIDQYKKTFYICKLQLDGMIDCRKEASFVVFTGKQGSEELQIAAPFIKNSISAPIKMPHVIVKRKAKEQ